MPPSSKYRLQALLDQRERGEDDARRALGEASEAELVAEASLLRARHRLREAREKLASRRSVETGDDAGVRLRSSSLLAEHSYRARLIAECSRREKVMRRQLELLEAARRDREARREGLADARREAELLRRHRERLAERAASARARAEESALDEAAIIAHRRRGDSR